MHAHGHPPNSHAAPPTQSSPLHQLPYSIVRLTPATSLYILCRISPWPAHQPMLVGPHNGILDERLHFIIRQRHADCR